MLKMKKVCIIAFAFFIGVFALLVAYYADIAPTQQRRRITVVPTRIAVLGDSRMYDLNYRNRNGFVNYLTNFRSEYPIFANSHFTCEDNNPETSQQVAGSDYYVSGANTPRLALMNFCHVLSNRHDAVIIHLGVNSIGSVYNTTNYFKTMFARAKANKMMVIVFTLTPWKGYCTWKDQYQWATDVFNRWVLSYPENVDVAVDIYTPLEDPDNPDCLAHRYQSDLLHVNSAGQRVIAGCLNAAVEKYFNYTRATNIAQANR